MGVVELAAILAAVALCVLVALAAPPLLRLRRTLAQAERTLGELNERALPILDKLDQLVDDANEELRNVSEVRRDAGLVASRAADVSADAAQFSHLVGAVFQKPLIKTAAFTYGVRKAIGGKQ